MVKFDALSGSRESIVVFGEPAMRSAPGLGRPRSFRGRGTMAPLLARGSKGNRGGAGNLTLPVAGKARFRPSRGTDLIAG
jgi:hypothetical protein